MRNRIKFMRRGEEFNITQQQLADAVGVHRNTIADIEKGADCSGSLMLKISNYFGKEPTEIFELEDKEVAE